VDENQVALGEERLSAHLADIVQREPHATVEEYRERVLQRLTAYRGSQLATDDSTFLVARRPYFPRHGGRMYEI